jgi:hypothetical protein
MAAVVAVVAAIAVLPGDRAPVAGPTDDSTTTSVSPATTAATDVTTSSSETAPPVPEPAPESRFVATSDGVVVVDGDEVVDHIDLGPVMVALAAGDEGIVFQVGQSASSILWMETTESDPVEIVPAEAGITLRLHEVSDVDGTPTVVYTARRFGPELTPEEVTEDLHTYVLDSGEDTVVGRLGGYESTALRVSYAADRFVASMIAEGYTWFEIIDGDEAGFANPRTEADAAEDFLVYVGHGAQSPDGSSMAYMRGSPRSEAPFEFVVTDLASGEELMAVPIEGAHESVITRLEWDGNTGVISLRDTGAVVVSDGAVVGRLPVVGIAG